MVLRVLLLFIGLLSFLNGVVNANDLNKTGWENEYIHMYGREDKANDYTDTERIFNDWGHFEYKLSSWDQIEPTTSCKELFPELGTYYGS